MKSKNLNNVYNVVSDAILDLDIEFENDLNEIYEVLDGLSANEKIDTQSIDVEEKIHKEFSEVSKNEPIENKIYSFTSSLFEENGNEMSRARDQIKNSIEGIGVINRLKNNAEFMKSRPKVENLLLFSPFWIRDPMFYPNNDGRHLLEYLFVKDKTPWPFMYNWELDVNKENMKWFIWFIILGQGGDLEAAGKLFGWSVKKGFSEHLLDEKIGFVNENACIESEIRRLGGRHHWHTSLLIKNSNFAIDPSDQYYNNSFISFWYSTVKWLIQNESSLDHYKYLKILKVAYEGYLEEGASFSMEGKSVDQFLDKKL